MPDVMMPSPGKTRYLLKADLLFVLFSSLVWLLLFSGARLFLLLWNFELASQASMVQLLDSFLIGVRFDLAVIVWLLLVPVLGLLFPSGTKLRRFYRLWMLLPGSLMLFAATAEAEFYREFHSRLNTIVLQYLSEDSHTVVSMVLHGSPVAVLFGVWLMFCVTAWLALRQIDLRTRWPAQNFAGNSYAGKRTAGNFWWRSMAFLCVFLVLVVAGRGKLHSGPPLRWGDAFQSNNLFANHLALNGIFTLNTAVRGWGKSFAADSWRDFVAQQEAENLVRSMLSVDGDHWSESTGDSNPILQRNSRGDDFQLGVRNVVFILLESFSGHFVGALGAEGNITPYFDELAQQGMLLPHFFSNGTHTHQGMFATFACFPNLPDYEYLMQQPEGDITFSGFPAVMHSLGYQNSVYVYNGDFAWDNQQGFFRKQGLDRFVGRDDFDNPIFIDPTWGVSDQDMFDRALLELDDLAQKGEFFAMLQTLSNHLPYALPEPLPVMAVTGYGSLDKHLTAMRYSDWALGQFFEAARNRPWFNDTLFVVLGDHGFGVEEQLTDIDLLRFRVPALFIAPGIRQKVGKRLDVVSSQPDLVPTAAAMLGKPFEHACWGRNLLAVDNNDPGFAVIKPSGSDKTVGLISGNEVLVKAPDISPQLYRYSLGRPESSESVDDPKRLNQLYRQLGSYIETALRSLSERRAGKSTVE